MDSPSTFTAEKLNDHFSSISFNLLAPSVDDFINEIEEQAEQFTSQTRGHEDILKSIIIEAFPVIGPYILDIFNSSVRESVFPSVWKKSLVLALNKVASPRTMSEMRPIAFLCFLFNVLERQ